jgi:hypothetical protein
MGHPFVKNHTKGELSVSNGNIPSSIFSTKIGVPQPLNAMFLGFYSWHEQKNYGRRFDFST